MTPTTPGALLPGGPSASQQRRPVAIKRQRNTLPDLILLYGPEGVGKTTWGLGAPAPVFIQLEQGVRDVEYDAFDPVPRDMVDVHSCLAYLADSDHGFKTLVIDSLTGLEAMIHADTCARNGWAHIEVKEFQKGFVAALEDWRQLLASLQAVREAGLEVVLLGHSRMANTANPVGPDYKRFEINVANPAANLLRQQADTVLFGMFEDTVVKDGKHDRTGSAYSTGLRYVKTTHHAAWDAKSRWRIPEQLPMAYSEYAEAREAAQPMTLAQARKEYNHALAMAIIDDPQREAMGAYVGDMTNVTRLVLAVQSLRTKPQQEPTT